MRRRVHIGAFFRHLFLILGGLISLFPFYWMFVLASRPSSVIYKYPPVLTPGNRLGENVHTITDKVNICLLYTSPSPRDRTRSRMPSSA